MNVTEISTLAGVAAAAGVMNALAGGGTLLTFPVLLFAGTPALTANATSTLALMLGTAGSVFGYRRHLAAVQPWLARFAVVSVVGGLLGSVLLTRTDEKFFMKMVPFLLLFATVVFLAQGVFRRFASAAEKSHATTRPHRVWIAIVFQFFVALYGGYFGAGIGILMLASLGFLGLSDIHEMNALKTVLGTLINFVAAGYFIFAGLIDWPKTGVMTAGALAGYFVGAHFSQQIPQPRVRQIISAIGFGISAVMFYRQFR